MAEYSRTTYDFNSRITLNDDSTDTDKYVLLRSGSLFDTVARNVEEERPSEAGIVDYGIKMSKGLFEVPIILAATSDAYMRDLIDLVKEAFHPDLLEADATYGEDTIYDGYHPMKWTETPSAADRAVQAYLKSMEIPIIESDSSAGLIIPATLKLKAEDPRKYAQTASTRTGAGVAANAGDIPTPVTITITASGATSTSLQIANSTTGESIYITTALSAGQVLVLNTRNHTALLDGSASRKHVGDSSKWFLLDPGNNTLAITNGANATIGFSWNSAWPL